jgi:hypothetical protein
MTLRRTVQLFDGVTAKGGANRNAGLSPRHDRRRATVVPCEYFE